MELTRRQSFALPLALAAAPGLAAAEPSLDELARNGGRRFGSTIGTRNGSFADPRYQALVTGECSLIVPENELKWQWLRPDPKTFDFAAADLMMKFADRNRLAVRGHNLLWHHPKWLPKWLDSYDFGAQPATEATRLLREHVTTVCTRYKSRIHSWDVVNEAVDHDTGALRETAFSSAMGSPEAVLDLAFRAARAATPGCQLVYNDYMGWEPNRAAHRDGVLRLLEGFRKRGTPVDALGVQAHIGSGNNPGEGPAFAPRDEAAWRRFLDAVIGMGYTLLITEFDVHDRGLPAEIAARDRAVADFGGAYLDLMLSYPQLGDVLVWGMCDRYSWLQERTPRADGLAKRPCSYDADFKPKPLRAAMADAFSRAPHRAAAPA